MLKRVDRVQIAVRDRVAAENTVAEIFGGELVRRDELQALGAKRTTMQAGTSLFELLEAAGAGAVGDFIDRWGGGLFAAGFSVEDVEAAAQHLGKAGVKFVRSGDQLLIDPGQTSGMRAVLSRHHERAPVGCIRHIYEVTNVIGDWRAAAKRYASIFALDQARFVPIASEQFGYAGALTMFDAPARLDRIELSQITRPDLAMGRFHKKRGDSLYMFYCEADHVEEIAQRLEAKKARFAAERRDAAGMAGLFIHPSAFLGVLVGVSRTEYAWNWSGDPARALRAAQGSARAAT